MRASSKTVCLAAVLAIVLACGIYVSRQPTAPTAAHSPADAATPASSDLIPLGPASASQFHPGNSEPEQIAPADESELPMPEAVFVWACQDPRAAAAWVQALPDGDVKESALESLAKGWATVSPRDALDFAAVQIGGRIGEKLTAVIASDWARRDLSGAHQWIASVPEGPMRSAAVLAVTDFLARHDPARSVSWLEQLPKGEARDAGISQAVGAWAKVDPAAALAWAQTADIADIGLQNELVFSALSELTQQDAHSAATWANTLPITPERDQAVRVLTQGLMENDPEHAFLWAGSIQDEEARRRESSAILQYWFQSDAKAARATLQKMLRSEPFIRDRAVRLELTEFFFDAEAYRSTLGY